MFKLYLDNYEEAIDYFYSDYSRVFSINGKQREFN